MRYCVVDVEATCWETKEEQGSQPNEIIQIGFVLVSDQRYEPKKFTYFVKPQFSKISKFCTNLTGITESQVKNSPTIDVVIEKIKRDFKLSSKFDSWFSYGNYDKNMLGLDPNYKNSLKTLYGINECIFHDMTHFNVKQLFAIAKNMKKPVGMDVALQMQNLELTGRHHDGADDAMNILKIIDSLFCGVEYANP